MTSHRMRLQMALALIDTQTKQASAFKELSVLRSPERFFAKTLQNYGAATRSSLFPRALWPTVPEAGKVMEQMMGNVEKLQPPAVAAPGMGTVLLGNGYWQLPRMDRRALLAQKAFTARNPVLGSDMVSRAYGGFRGALPGTSFSDKLRMAFDRIRGQ